MSSSILISQKNRNHGEVLNGRRLIDMNKQHVSSLHRSCIEYSILVIARNFAKLTTHARFA